MQSNTIKWNYQLIPGVLNVIGKPTYFNFNSLIGFDKL